MNGNASLKSTRSRRSKVELAAAAHTQPVLPDNFHFLVSCVCVVCVFEQMLARLR